ncbi:MAG: hypothetical protein CMF57_08445, partial [Leifsonia sp.]|nr:hypothetical protein [Leifsonia sp.]
MTDITIDRTAAKQAERDAAVVRKLKSTSALVLLLLAATSFAAGVPGLLDAGRWARLGEMAWLTPIAIDGGLVFFSASAMAWRAETAKASALGWTMVWLLSAVSVGGCQMVCVRGVGFLRKEDTDDHDRQGSSSAAAA